MAATARAPASPRGPARSAFRRASDAGPALVVGMARGFKMYRRPGSATGPWRASSGRASGRRAGRPAVPRGEPGVELGRVGEQSLVAAAHRSDVRVDGIPEQRLDLAVADP